MPRLQLPARGIEHPPYLAQIAMPLLPSAPSVTSNVRPSRIIQQKMCRLNVCVKCNLEIIGSTEAQLKVSFVYILRSRDMCFDIMICDSVFRNSMLFTPKTNGYIE